MKQNQHNYRFQNPSVAKPNRFPIPDSKVRVYDLYPAFSFRYYDVQHPKYSAKSITQLKDFYTFFSRLHEMSKFTWGEIKQQKFFRFHDVQWDDTAEKSGFKNLPKTQKEMPVYQFEVFQECRVFGFLNAENIFEIVWIDRQHRVYPRK